MMYTEQPAEPPVAEEEVVPRNMRCPREAPAWLKHDKQVRPHQNSCLVQKGNFWLGILKF